MEDFIVEILSISTWEKANVPRKEIIIRKFVKNKLFFITNGIRIFFRLIIAFENKNKAIKKKFPNGKIKKEIVKILIII